jgi:hypothetical protein
MSTVTNVILAFSIMEDEPARLADVNRLLTSGSEPIRRGFVYRDRTRGGDIGGTHCLEQPTYIGAFNYLDREEFLAGLPLIAWEEPECVQVIMCLQDHDRYHVAYENGRVIPRWWVEEGAR